MSATETVIFVYDAGGKLVAEYSTNVSQTPQVQYLTNDHLGTPRINTNENGAVVSRTDYMPYGEEIIGLGGRSTTDKYVTDDVRQGFTGYLNDEETGLDYAQARMYKKELGRFTGADPLLASGRTSLPGSWNRYAYCWNNPLKLVDPTGKDVLMLDEKARSRVLSTLPESIRKQVEKQIKKDGTLKRGSLDKIKSDDPNFLDLKQIVDNKATLEIMTATADPRKGGGDFDYETKEEKRSIIIARELELGSGQEEAEEAANESLNNPDAVQNISLGVTLPPNSDGNPSKNYRVILADGTGKTADAPESELAARSAHEIYGHGLPAIKGEPWQSEYTQPPGPVDRRILEIEKRTRNLYKKQ